MAAPTRELEKLIVSRKLAHGGNPVTRWMASNVAAAQDPAGNLKPQRQVGPAHHMRRPKEDRIYCREQAAAAGSRALARRGDEAS
jgi:hypothetical protein